MKTNNILGSKGLKGSEGFKGVLFGAMALLMTACTLDYEPISTPTELTEGSQTEESTAVLKDKQAAQDQLTNLYELFRSIPTMPTPVPRVPRWSLTSRMPSMPAIRY